MSEFERDVTGSRVKTTVGRAFQSHRLLAAHRKSVSFILKGQYRPFL